MKKKLFMLTLVLCLILMTACGENNTISDHPNSDLTPSPIEETLKNTDTKKNTDPTKNTATEKSKDNTSNDEVRKQSGREGLNETVSTDVENTISSIESEYEKLITDIDTYEKYLENIVRIEAFYKEVCEETRLLCIRMREYSVIYANEIMASDKTNDEKYDDLDALYDYIYDDAGDDIYDEIYDDIFDDLYDDFYDGILDDAYDNGAPYAEWSDARSGEYHRWSDTRSDVYSEWSDFRSDVYGFWSDMRTALWKDNIEKAEKEIADFQKDIEKIKSKSIGSDTQASNNDESSDATFKDTDKENEDINSNKEKKPNEDINSNEEINPNEDINSNEELVDGMRPEFKRAMDSYEAFYDEYCDILKKYTANPTDIGLLSSYTKMLTKLSEMTEEFEKWDNDEMNNAELKYYLDVTNHVTQKLLEVYE